MSNRTSRSSHHSRAASTGKVRVIAGEWRGRWIRFNNAQGLRPTGDRMRETLFNWLQSRIRGARCLDLFAGTGALGIEAVSRGAAVSALVEQNPSVCQQLEKEIETLATNPQDVNQRLPVHKLSAEAFLQNPAFATGPFDIVFVDPPFSADVQVDILQLLRESGQLADDALVYVEAPAKSALQARLPATYEIYRSLKQGNVQCVLLQSLEVAS